MFLETKRTLLRPFAASDLRDLHSLFACAEAMKYIPPNFTSETIENTKKRLEDYMNHFSQYNCSFLYVSNKQLEFLGRAGFYYLKEVDAFEIGYSLLPKFWGQGLATEIGEKLIDCAFNQLKLSAIVARTINGNVNSEKVLQKLGFLFIGKRKFPVKAQEFDWNYFQLKFSQ